MKSFSLFLNDLLEQESGISPNKFNWYIDNYNNKVIDYYDVESPGIVKRNYMTGRPLSKKLTVYEYFCTLGIAHLFDATNPDCIKNMQYHSINALGFIGYQFGEALLYDLEIYIPSKKLRQNLLVDSYYMGGIDDKFWSAGVTEYYTYNEFLNKGIIATHVNLWEGEFKGLLGLNNFDDLKSPLIQEKIIIKAFYYNLKILKKLFNISKGIDLLTIFKENKYPESTFHELFEIYDEGILSGILAAMHLCGPYGFYDLYSKNKINYDEFSVSIVKYIHKFSDYDVYDIFI